MTARKRFAPLVGMTFNGWTVLEQPLYSRHNVLCRCECGTEHRVVIANVLSGLSTRCKSCGSRLAKIQHGDSDSGGHDATRLYCIWKAMKWRCSPANLRAQSFYFDRGIRVCPEWQDSYLDFRDWALANGYKDDLTIDRRDNNSGYSPANCRWVGYKAQARNTRRNRLVTAFGETKSVVEWSEDPRCEVNQKVLARRLRLGWGDHAAVTTPSGVRGQTLVPSL